MLWLNYFCILSLLVSVSAKYIPPQLFWLPAFFGLAFPYLVLLNLFFLLYWTVQLRRALLFSLLTLGVALPTSMRYVQAGSAEISRTKLLSLTSYNCMLFDLYNWKKNHITRPKIFGSLADIQPDLICFQEFYTSEQKKDFNNIDSVKKYLGFSYYHAEYTYTQFETDHWGAATFSKYPIINRGKIIFNTESNNICIYSDIVVGKDTLRIYNLHLQSISFSDSDTKFLDQVMAEDKDANGKLENSKSILRRLKRAFSKRAIQAETVAAHMSTSPYRIILCGDFNDTASSYAYEVLCKNRKDAFVEKGSGLGKTYAGKWPQFRIDYIIHDPALKCRKYQRSEETFTDHYPITAWFEL